MSRLVITACVVIGIIFTSVSAVSAEITGPYARQVQQMYVAYYGRPGDVAGIEYWADRLEEAGGNWIMDMVNAFGSTPEYVSRFGHLTDEQLIDNLFDQLFNRSSDPEGKGFYIDLLYGTNESGYNLELRQSTLAMIALDISNGAAGNDQITLQNKLHVAEYFTDRILDESRPYTESDIPTAAEVVSVVGANAFSMQQGYGRAECFALTPANGMFVGCINRLECNNGNCVRIQVCCPI